jgi:hypothetical protein
VTAVLPPVPRADPAAELGGPAVRRLVRRAGAARADTTVGARLADAMGTLASVGIGVAVLGGSLASLREDIAARPPAPGGVLPGGVTAGLAALAAGAGLVLVLDRLGPVSATPAAAAWWLPLPADRRGLLRGELRRVTVACVLVGAALGLPLALAGTASASGVLAGVAGGGLAGAVLAGAATVLQTRGSAGRLAPAAGAVVVLAGAVPAVLATIAAAGGSGVLPGLPDLALPPWWPAVAALPAVLLLTVLLLVTAERGLGRLRGGDLRDLGGTSGYAAASVLSLDTRDLGRALAARRRRTPRRRWRSAWVRRPWQALVAADLAVLARGRWQAGQLVLAVALPVVAARSEGVNQLPVVVWVLTVAGGLLAAVAAGASAREAQVAPGIDRLVPVDGARVTWVRAVVPLAVGAGTAGLGGLLVGLGSGSPAGWAALGLATAPVWAAAAVRGAHRPELDWAGPVVSTPMGAVPTGVAGTLLEGVDVAVLGTLPLAVVLLVGGPPGPGAVLAQLGWALAVGAGGLALTARRRTDTG